MNAPASWTFYLALRTLPCQLLWRAGESSKVEFGTYLGAALCRVGGDLPG